MQTDFPASYSISVGEYPCNLRCRMCPMYGGMPKEKKYITDDLFELACKNLGDRKRNFEISAYGEPFLHPHMDDYMLKARKICPNAEIVIATNGLLLDEERCKKIIDSGIDHISYSLDAGSEESYKWLCGSSNYAKVCANLERLVELRNERNAKHLKITTHIIGIKELAHEFDSFIKRWSPVVDFAQVRPYGNWAGMVDNNGISPATEQIIPAERYPCVWLWYATKIEYNGKVSKCHIHVVCDDKDPLGNIQDEPFEKIWNGNKIKRLRELHLKNKYNCLEHCENCTVWSLFHKFWDKKFLKKGWK